MNPQPLMESVFFQSSIAQSLACLLYTLPLNKRRQGPFLPAAAILAAVFLRALYARWWAQFDYSVWLWLGNVAVSCATMLLQIWLTCRVGWADCVLCLVLADLTQNFMISAFNGLRGLCLLLIGPPEDGLKAAWPIFVPLLAVLAAVFYFAAARALPEKGRYNASPALAGAAVLIDIPALFFVNLNIIFYIAEEGAWADVKEGLLRMIVDLCALLLLYLLFKWGKHRELEHSYHLLEQTLEQQYQQYLLSRDTIDLINRKCHDLRHQIAALEAEAGSPSYQAELNELKESVRIYDTFCHTGNDVLDTVLTEKALVCEDRDIVLTCVVDGAALSFVAVSDLCAMFGNALDNAIEGVERLQEPAKRLIHVTVFAEKGMVMLRVENPFEGGLTLEDGLPVTTKEKNGYHGFGLKSIRYTAQRYGGAAKVYLHDGWFELRVLLPQPYTR